MLSDWSVYDTSMVSYVSYTEHMAREIRFVFGKRYPTTKVVPLNDFLRSTKFTRFLIRCRMRMLHITGPRWRELLLWAWRAKPQWIINRASTIHEYFVRRGHFKRNPNC